MPVRGMGESKTCRLREVGGSKTRRLLCASFVRMPLRGGTLPRHKYVYLAQQFPKANARLGRADRNWTRSGGRLFLMAGGFVSG